MKNGNVIIKFALDELKKTIEDLKQGKTPIVSRDLKKIVDILNTGDSAVKDKKISEEDMNNVVEKITTDLEKKVK